MVDGELEFSTKLDKSGLDKGIKGIDQSLGGLKTSLKSLAKVAAAAFSVKAVSDFAKETKEAYNVQSEAEIKLTTIMKQRMNATNDVIDGIKALASEQQQLGVIGDEIQLAGAQQVATFLNEADSIKTLLPAMNDLLAQQQGLNASSGDAVNIANLMGKVMQGQTSALKRVGISFSEAEEEVLKYGTESEKAAMLAQVITNNVGHMNHALAQTDAGKQKQLSNTLGDVKEQFGQAVLQIESVFLPAVQKVADWLGKIASLAQTAGAAFREAFGVAPENNSAVIAANTSQAADSYEDMSDSAKETAKAQKTQLAAFDKITKLTGSESDSEDAPSSVPTAPLGGTATLTVEAETSGAGEKLRQFIKEVKKIFNDAKKVLRKFASWVKTNFGDFWNGLWDGLKAEGTELVGTLGGISSDVKSLFSPLKDWLSGDFKVSLQTAFGAISDIVLGLFDTFNTVFSDIWNLAVYPRLQSFITLGLPLVSQFVTEYFTTLDTFISQVKELFDTLWADAAEPALTGISGLFTDIMSSMSSAWGKWGAPIFDDYRAAIKNTGDTLKNVWNKTMKPVWDEMSDTSDYVWKKHLKPLVDNFLDLVGTFVDGGLQIYNDFILPVVNWLNDTLGSTVKTVFENIVQWVGSAVSLVSDLASDLIDILKDITNFIVDVFTGDWENAWNDITDIFSDVCTLLGDLFKAPVNLIIAGINKLFSGFESLINNMADALNEFSIDVPGPLQSIVGFKKFGFDLDHIDIPEIPELARGTVVPANYGEFLAVLGDNKREAEVVAPYSTIVKAVKDAMGGTGGAKQPAVINLYIQTRSGVRAVSQAVVDDINDIIDSTGSSPIRL